MSDIAHEHIAPERYIAWHVAPADIPWAREHLAGSSSPSALPALPRDWQVVAVAVVRRQRGFQGYPRRIWFRKPGDAAAYGDHDWPAEAVRPDSIRPRSRSVPMGDPREVWP